MLSGPFPPNKLLLIFRYDVVDYAGPAGSNEGVIMSKKPGPASPALNFINVLSSFQYHEKLLVVILLLTSPCSF